MRRRTPAFPPFRFPKFGRPTCRPWCLTLPLGAHATQTQLPGSSAPKTALAEARRLLLRLGAIDGDGALTPDGRAMRALPLNPRLARMLVHGQRAEQAALAAQIAVVLSERSAAPDLVDVSERVVSLRQGRGRGAEDGRRLALAWAKAAGGDKPRPHAETSAGSLLALAFPDRIAKPGAAPDEFLMANGRAGALDATDPLARSPWIVVADLAGRAGAQRILAAAALSSEEAKAAAGADVVSTDEIFFDAAASMVRRRNMVRLGAITMTEQILPAPPTLEAAQALAMGVVQGDLLPWSEPLRVWRDRVQFMRNLEGDPWPDLSDAGLARDPNEWLAPIFSWAADWTWSVRRPSKLR